MPSGVTVWPACARTSQSEPRSAPRSELKVQNTFHCSNPVSQAGRLASAQATAAAPAAHANRPSDRRRQATTRIGPSRNSGYSLVAVPSPISTPVSTGRSRDHAHRAPATIATAIRSQLTSPATSRTGESTKYSASHGRPRWVPARNQVAMSPKTASSSAVTRK